MSKRIVVCLVILLLAFSQTPGIQANSPDPTPEASSPKGLPQPGETGHAAALELSLPEGSVQSQSLVPANMTENFEGAWPGAGWQLRDLSDTDGGEFLMAPRDCHPHQGSLALWTIGGGTAGSALACGANYPDNAFTWAIYGPFSLTGATSASLAFDLYGKSEAGAQCPYDRVGALSSIDGTNFSGTVYCGDYTTGTDGNGYHRLTLDLSSHLGESQVWVAFVFESDSSVNDIGFTIDDVALSSGAGPAPTATPTRTTAPGPTMTPTRTSTPRPGGTHKAFLPCMLKNQRIVGATVRDSRGKPVNTLTRADAVYTDFAGLLPRTQYDIQLLDPNGSELTLSRFTTDAGGMIPASALAYDLGLTMAGNAPQSLNAFGRHTIVVRTVQGAEVYRRQFDVTDPQTPVVYAANDQGNASNSFLVNVHTVYVRGEHFQPGARVLLFVVADQAIWEDGQPLANVTSGAQTATAATNGTFLVPVWVRPGAVGAYDVVADVNWDGKYTAGVDLVDSYTPVGFMVQRATDGNDVQVQLACDVQGNYKDVFSTNEGVYMYVNPPTRQFVHRFGYKYIVMHQDVWNNGDRLVDVTEGWERDHPQYGCTNEGRVLVWPPSLAPGVYDAVFDVDHDGVYDKGLDLLDNIDTFGNAVGGFFVPGAPGSPQVAITAPANGSSSTDGVILLEGTANSPTPITWARWFVNAGTQSNSGELQIANGHFSQRVYLFPGRNTVQVWVRNQAGTGTASIIVNSAISGVWDIHAQLVWDTVGTDVDLHLLRPQGARNSSGDCFYGDCTHDNRSANPDWGRASVAEDNPRLDIDCVPSRNCTGPENITLNTFNWPEANGRYTVEAYYYSDWGKGAAHARVNLWIRGRLYTFGPVTLQNHQWWTVCTIDWPAGLVTPSGAIGMHPSAAAEGAEERFPVKEAQPGAN